VFGGSLEPRSGSRKFLRPGWRPRPAGDFPLELLGLFSFLKSCERQSAAGVSSERLLFSCRFVEICRAGRRRWHPAAASSWVLYFRVWPDETGSAQRRPDLHSFQKVIAGPVRPPFSFPAGFPRRFRRLANCHRAGKSFPPPPAYSSHGRLFGFKQTGISAREPSGANPARDRRETRRPLGAVAARRLPVERAISRRGCAPRVFPCSHWSRRVVQPPRLAALFCPAIHSGSMDLLPLGDLRSWKKGRWSWPPALPCSGPRPVLS